MNPEKAIEFSDDKEELSPVEKFDNLLEQMLELADYKTGSISLPQVNIIFRQKLTPTVFQIFNPAPLEGYAGTSVYPVSISLERGQKVHEDGTGKILHDAERLYVERPLLEISDPYDEKRIEATLNLVRIEKHFEDYKKTIESLKKSEQEQQ